MKLSDFDFDLPPELIAQEPAEQRDQSNLILPFENNRITKFARIIDYLKPGDVMVFNDSRVIKAKLTLNKEGRKINVNLNKPLSDKIVPGNEELSTDRSDNQVKWSAFAKPAKKLKIGDEFFFDNHKIVVINKYEFGEIEISFVLDNIDIFSFLERYGEMPLPLYIKRPTATQSDLSRYQNIYSNQDGSVAAPTAGLHFSDDLMRAIKDKNIDIQFVTLHIGAGTFLPVKTENIEDHKMHSEYCYISPETVRVINKAKAEKRRIIAVGTTAMRTLESLANNGQLLSGSKNTDIFITPSYDFQIADCLITNFHLPKSTLFMLVCAFSGVTEMKNLYKYAIENKMRFFSYGDAMMLYRK